MKRKFMIPLLAAIVGLVLVFGVSAFKDEKSSKVDKLFATYTFHYVPTTYTQPMVETESNWTFGSAGNCDGTVHKACEVEVLDTYTHLDANNNRVLNTSGSFIPVIAAEAGTGVTTYVVKLSTSVGINSKIDKN
jgi:hypothetical protein